MFPIWATSQSGIELGDYHKGGVVFYVERIEQHGLIFLNKTFEETWVDFMKMKGA